MPTVAEQVRQVLSDPLNLPAEFLSYLVQYQALNPVPSGAVSAPILSSTGLTGATKSSRIVGSTASGPPTQGTFQQADQINTQDGHVWVCTSSGAPGLWVDASIAPLQAAAAVTLAGDLHLTSAGNTIEQSAAMQLKSVVSNPITAPTLSTARNGGIVHNGSGWYAFVCYTWVDGSGHESAPSPVSSAYPIPDTGGFAGVTASVDVAVPTLPLGATGFHIYATEQSGSTPPAAATLKRQAATTYITSETATPTNWNGYNSSGANPPGASNFPTGTSAKITAADGSTLIAGDGTVRMPATAADKSSSSVQSFAGGIVSTNPSAGNGYATGAGGNVTQATNKTTAVTLDKVTGQVMMNNAALAGGATVTFSVNNATVGANDCVTANIVGPAGTSGSYSMTLPHVANGGGAFRLFITNTTGGPLSDALLISFAVVKVATS